MRKILIFDGSTLKGHHEIYLRKFLSILTSSEYKVYLYCENNSYIIQTLDKKEKELCEALEIQPSILEKALFKIFLITDLILAELISSFPNSYLSRIIPLILVKNLQKQIKEEVPVFFLSIDAMFPRLPLWLSKLISIFPKTWCAFYIKPLYLLDTRFDSQDTYWKFVEEKNFSLPSCKSVLLLDPDHEKYFNKRFSKVLSIYLPEIIEASKQEDCTLSKNILDSASKRKIISIVGSLLPKRNLLLFLKTALKLDKNRFFFLIIGSMPEHLYTKEELYRIKIYRSQLDSNSYIRTDYYIPKESEFNTFLNISDLIYLQYKDHAYSSNILAKAIGMRKPVIVSPGYLMEKTVKRYNWQAVVPEEPQQIAETIESLTSTFDIDEESYSRFLKDHSDKAFSEAVLEAVNALW